ncbi:hypothetical protein [Enterococcus mundtii]|uniref:hypothetical protein n=1 Tax=Enterococcus mundtii TaxID=53346 RepID=UPI001A971B4F|nr:hypothetical protein [Enterococcus mundtii]MBO1087206.1 hypothetical protein [Enterococcus mundtii]
MYFDKLAGQLTKELVTKHGLSVREEILKSTIIDKNLLEKEQENFEVQVMNRNGKVLFEKSGYGEEKELKTYKKIEKQILRQHEEETELAFPFRILKDRVTNLTKYEYSNSKAKRFSRNETYNGFDCVLQVNSENDLDVLIKVHNAANPIFIFNATQDSRVVRMNIKNIQTFFTHESSQYLKLISYIESYLEVEPELRKKELESR